MAHLQFTDVQDRPTEFLDLISLGFQALAPEKVRLADNDGLMPRDESEGVFPEKSTFSGKIFMIQHVFSII